MLKKVAIGMLLLCSSAAQAVPVVPNFQQGQMTSHTETTSETVETINSYDYNSGYTYSISGHGVRPQDNGDILPSSLDSTTNTINGVTSTWTGLDHTQKPNFTLVTPGEPFQFTESYSGPGLSNHTIIQRTTTIQSVTNTTSTFSN